MTRLKSLELQGYKTFASKALFEFPGSITAIVGPNGSGKSNIADAIRWVLGEQAYSILRGKKTEDMIFSGSELRPRAGMALASITFDNEDGWLPIDFNEVVITRRAYRDGENEYMLNNQRVRLKEINELLSQTGLAERTYTIIGQGLVDAALSLKPDERRRFFEEAAGIGLYRSRRDESISRLEATKRNLERVNDIISELGPRVNSLERQARKVQEYERIRSDLRMMLRDWYGFQWNKSNSELLQAGSILKEREKNLEKARDTTQEVEEKYNGFHAQIQELKGQQNNYNRQLTEQHQMREVKTRELAVMEERVLGLKSRLHDLEIQISTINEEINSNTKSIDELSDENLVTSQEVTEIVKDRDLTQSSLDKRLKERAEIEKIIQDYDKERVLLQTQKIKQNIHNEHLLQSIKEINENLLRNQTQVEELEKAIASNCTIISELDLQINNLCSHLGDAKEELTLAEQDYLMHLDLLSDHKVQHNARNSEADTFVQRLKFYENAKSQMVGISDGAKKLMETARTKDLYDVVGFLHQFLNVPEKYERAINSSLGEAIDTIIISGRIDLAAIRTFLTNTSSQKTYLFGKLSAKKDGKHNNKNTSNFPRLLDFITYPEDLKLLMYNLLENYYFIENDDDAFDASAILPEGSICVSGLGNVYHSSGLIVIAGDGIQSGLTYSREISEAQTHIEEIKKSLKVLEKSIADEERAVVQKKDGLISLKKRIETITNELKDKQEKKSLYETQNEQLLEKIKWNNEQKAILDEKLGQDKSESDSISRILFEVNAKDCQFESEINEARQKLDLLPTLELAETLSERLLYYQKINQKSQILNTQIQERKNQNKVLQQRLAILLNQKESGEQETRQIEDTKQKVSVLLNTIKEQISILQNSTAPLDKSISEKEIENQAYLNNLSNARQSLTFAERFYAQAQLDYSRQKDKLDNLRAKIEDDFGLVAFTYAEEIEGPSPLPFDGLVEQLPNLTLIPENLEESILRQRAILRRIGPINQEADREYKESRQRLDFLNEQVTDLKKADEDLRKVINELDILIRTDFKKTFDAVAFEFHSIFSQLFIGGSAKLSLSESEDPNEIGVDIEAKLPGRREQGLSLLSGGERSLTATALIFALLRVSPTPFCVLDEVDAMLDESNVGRFCELLTELSHKTQFLVITHNRNTVQVADVIYGVTMGRDSASQVIGLKMDELSEEMVK